MDPEADLVSSLSVFSSLASSLVDGSHLQTNMGVGKARMVLRESSERGEILRRKEEEKKNRVAISNRVKGSEGYRLRVGRGRRSSGGKCTSWRMY